MIETINEIALRSYTAFLELKKTNLKQRAALMNAIADEIEALGAELIQTASSETNLPEGRLTGEKGRTVFQWRNYADALESGYVLNSRIDTAIPEKVPPRPDIRKTYFGLGPVVVFGASNFPYAFSTAGGDTASAIAAGCSVIIKGHPAHPKTAKMMGDAIQRGIQKTGFHKDTFAQVFSYEAGSELILHPLVKAVTFTGSFKGGKALFDLANSREEPIPVFAEMGSVNPIFVLPQKMKSSPAQIVTDYLASLTMGVGQFCTNPGILIIPEEHGDFLSIIREEAKKIQVGKMLHPGISEAFAQNKNKLLGQKNIEVISECDASLALTYADDFLSNDSLQEEVFGPFGLIVVYKSTSQLVKIAKKLKGQLTATILGEAEEIGDYEELILNITEKCGRLLFNGYPTGVEVATSMQHGGPFPATTDSRFTSVGADAIRRFARPVAYQNMPDQYLPDELKHGNPLQLPRWVNGEITKQAI